MKLQVFTVYDSKIEAFASPFICKTKGEAIRSWIDIVNDRQSAFSKHPEDFTLMHIAEYDDSSGRYENFTVPKSLGLAIEYIKKGNNDEISNVASIFTGPKSGNPEERV